MRVQAWLQLTVLAAFCAFPLRATNAVGYVSVPLPQGYSLVGATLFSAHLTIREVFSERPAGTRIYTMENGQFLEISAGSSRVLQPGEAVVVYNPEADSGAAALFVGEVPQGTLVNSIPAGLSLISPMIPMAASLDELSFEAMDGDQVYVLDPATGMYHTHTYIEFFGGWYPAAPTLRAGEGFIIRTAYPRDWVIEFNIIDGILPDPAE